jgi:hypothetical protein
MSHYRQASIEGGLFFFTVTLADGSSNLLMQHIDRLRRIYGLIQRNQTDLARHIDYIHFNPVKHELVRCVCDWPYSSFKHFAARGDLPRDWGGDLGEMSGKFGESPTRGHGAQERAFARPTVLQRRDSYASSSRIGIIGIIPSANALARFGANCKISD